MFPSSSFINLRFTDKVALQTGKFVRMFAWQKYENSWRCLEIRQDFSSSDNDVRSFYMLSWFIFSPISLAIDNQLWRTTYKMLWFSIPSRFSSCIAWCIDTFSRIPMGYLSYTAEQSKQRPKVTLISKSSEPQMYHLEEKTDPSPSSLKIRSRSKKQKTSIKKLKEYQHIQPTSISSFLLQMPW